MTPEMWLDLEPIPHRASCEFAADRPNPSGSQHGVALLVAWLVLTFYYVKGATFYIVTVSRLGGLGHQISSRSACRQPGAATPVLRGLPGSDESRASQTKRPGGSTGCWLGRCLVPIGR